MLVLELTRRKAGRVAVRWKFMSFRERTSGKRRDEIVGGGRGRRGSAGGLTEDFWSLERIGEGGEG